MSNQPVTEDQLKQILQSNNSDLIDRFKKYSDQTFTTKDEVREIIGDELKQVVGSLPSKDDFFTAMDKLMGEVKAKREEQTTHAQQHVDINDKFDQVGTKLKLNLSF